MAKKKILLLSDDLRMSSGVGTMSREFVLGTLKEYDWVQVGGAIKHPDEGKIIDMNETCRKETGIEDAYLKIYPVSGYGNGDLLKQVLDMETKDGEGIDAILHYTDPRFWGWLYNMEHEIRQNIPIFYYNKEAFLAQSPQLYKEQLTMSFEKVFEIAPIFRAEPSRTNRHLAEAISIDLEEAFVDYNDVMSRIEDIIKVSINAVNEYIKNNPDSEFTPTPVPESIPRYTYDDLVDRMQKAGAKTEWGDDLYP